MTPRRPIDLERARAAEEDLRATLAANPEVRERTARFLSGELKGGPMAQEGQPVRVPGELLDRADKLVPILSTDPELRAWGRVSRASVIRLALLRELEVLERRAVKTEANGNRRG